MNFYKKLFVCIFFISFFCVSMVNSNDLDINEDFIENIEFCDLSEDEITNLENLSAKGDTESSYWLGKIYTFGDENKIERSRVKALKYLEAAANNGNVKAQFMLFKVHYYGLCGKIDINEGIKWLEKSAQNGYHCALGCLGAMYYSGKNVKKDCHKAINLIEEAALKGNQKAKYNLANVYHFDGARRDDKRSMQYLVESQGGTEASAQEALLYLYGATDDEAGKKFLNQHFNKHKTLALEGNNDSQYIIGTFYEYGLVVPKDFAKAIDFYQKAANLGSAEACIALAKMYIRGNGVKKDEEKAFLLLASTINKNDCKHIHAYSNAIYTLGYMYFYGEGVKKDCEKGYKLYLKSARLGDWRAHAELGGMYYEGIYKKRNYRKAFYYFISAANKSNCAEFQSAVGYMYLSGKGVVQNSKEALYWLTRSAEQGNSLAQCNLGAMYSQGDGVEINSKKAVELFKKSAEQGDEVAQYNLGMMLLEGTGIDQNTNEALKLFKESYKNGYEAAADMVSEIESQIIDWRKYLYKARKFFGNSESKSNVLKNGRI